MICSGVKLWETSKTWKDKELYGFEALGDLENVEKQRIVLV